MSQTSESPASVPPENRIIAAEVALVENLPGVARLFLSGVEESAIAGFPVVLRGRFMRALAASRVPAV